MPVLGSNLVLAAGVAATTAIAGSPCASDAPTLNNDLAASALNPASHETEIKDESMLESSVGIQTPINTGASRGRNRQLQKNTPEEELEKEVSSQEPVSQKETTHKNNEVGSTVNDAEGASNTPSCDEVNILEDSLISLLLGL